MTSNTFNNTDEDIKNFLEYMDRIEAIKLLGESVESKSKSDFYRRVEEEFKRDKKT